MEEVREESTPTSPPPGPPPSWVMTHRVLWPGTAMGSSPGSALTSTPCSFIAAFQLELSRASAPSHLLQQRLNAARLPRRGMESPNSTTPVTPWEETRTSGPPATPQKRAPTHTGSPQRGRGLLGQLKHSRKSSSPGTRSPLPSSTHGCALPVPALNPRCCHGHPGVAASTALEDNSPPGAGNVAREGMRTPLGASSRGGGDSQRSGRG